MKWLIGIIIIIGFYLAFHLVSLTFEKSILPSVHNSSIIDDKQDALNSEYNFVVTKKYLDSANHNNETIVGKDFNNNDVVIYGARGYWELYKVVAVGDTLLKKKKSYIFKLSNGYKKAFDIGKEMSSYN